MNPQQSALLRVLSTLALFLLAVGTAQGQPVCASPPFFSQGPTSQLGNLTNNLILLVVPNGFEVQGDVTIAVPAGPKAGTLVSWEVRCPLTATSATGVSTTTKLDGFSQPPAVGTFNPTSGAVETTVTGVGIPSLAKIPISLLNGAATWNNLVAQSGPYNLNPPPTGDLVQRFTVDGVQASGPGGNWVVDVPVSSVLNGPPAPAPGIAPWGLAALAALLLGSGTILRRRRQRAEGAHRDPCSSRSLHEGAGPFSRRRIRSG